MEEEKKRFSVILLKTRDQDSDDRYVSFLCNHEKAKRFSLIEQINLLSIETINNFEFGEKLFSLFFRKGEKQFYRCLILTSRQTVEAFSAAISNFQNKDLTSLEPNSFTVFCDGTQTALKFKETLKELNKTNAKINEDLIKVKICQEEKQNAVELSKLVIDEFKKDQSYQDGFYALYPCSSIRKDDLSVELRKNQILFDEIHVYKTAHSKKGLEQLNILVQRLKDFDSIICLVFFSPSGVDAVFKESSNKTAQIILNNKEMFKIISVGPSTTTQLKVYLTHYDIYQMSQPAPQPLLDVLLRL